MFVPDPQMPAKLFGRPVPVDGEHCAGDRMSQDAIEARRVRREQPRSLRIDGGPAVEH